VDGSLIISLLQTNNQLPLVTNDGELGTKNKDPQTPKWGLKDQVFEIRTKTKE